jgi:GNAT superfamily N-acetyltransferase
MAMSGVEVKPVASKKDFRRFIRFPREVYRGDPNWVQPLIMDVKDRLNIKKNPFFEHAERELFLAWRDGTVAGRVVAVIDRNHNSFHEEKVVFFGMYESLNDLDTAKSLLETVAAWGKARGMNTLRGTVNLSMNEECAFLLEGFDSPPAVMMPYNPRYYNDLMDASGLVKARDLYAFLLARDHETAAKVKAIVDTIKKSTTVTTRPINLKKWEEEAEKIICVYNNAWVKNWGFVPWTENEMRDIVKKLKQVADPELVIIAEDKGQPVGFSFGLPNLNELLININGRLLPFGIIRMLLGRKKIKGVRMLVFGVLKEYQHTGLAYLLADEMKERGFGKGYHWAELSWTLETNEAVNKFAAAIGGKIHKKYRIYERKIEGKG